MNLVAPFFFVSFFPLPPSYCFLSLSQLSLSLSLSLSQRQPEARVVFTFLRHAESVFNETGYSGYDAPITRRGAVRASELTGDYDYVMVSTMLRARETFARSAITSPSVEFSTLCRERMIETPCNMMSGETGVAETEEDFLFRMQMLRSFLKRKSATCQRIRICCHHKVMRELVGVDAENCESVTLARL